MFPSSVNPIMETRMTSTSTLPPIPNLSASLLILPPKWALKFIYFLATSILVHTTPASHSDHVSNPSLYFYSKLSPYINQTECHIIKLIMNSFPQPLHDSHPHLNTFSGFPSLLTQEKEKYLTRPSRLVESGPLLTPRHFPNVPWHMISSLRPEGFGIVIVNPVIRQPYMRHSSQLERFSCWLWRSCQVVRGPCN